MNFAITYPKGGNNTPREPLHITTNISAAAGFTIQSRTCGCESCRLILIDENNKEVENYYYDYRLHGRSYYLTMARDVARDINVVLASRGRSEKINTADLCPTMKEVFAKCESRCGAPIPDSEYEALVIFQ